MKFIISSLLIIFSQILYAEIRESGFDYNQEIRDKARYRTYEGGSDEEDIKVQSPLLNPVRKMGPDTLEEAVSDEATGEEPRD